jgi:sugar O-acyltransferase (sialic acid O-acetyltransferase NeuD family)
VTERPKQIYVIGAGGHGKVAIRAAQLSGQKVVAVFDDAEERIGSRICDVPVIGVINAIRNADPLPAFIAIGENRIRMRIAKQLDLPWATVVHPHASIDCHAEIGSGVLVLAGAVIQIHACIGDHAIVNNNATVEHDCRVKAGAHISSNACLAGGSSIGTETLIGTGASVLPGIHIGGHAIVGAGAVVTRNLNDRVTAVGVPASVVKAVS